MPPPAQATTSISYVVGMTSVNALHCHQVLPLPPMQVTRRPDMAEAVPGKGPAGASTRSHSTQLQELIPIQSQALGLSLGDSDHNTPAPTLDVEAGEEGTRLVPHTSP